MVMAFHLLEMGKYTENVMILFFSIFFVITVILKVTAKVMKIQWRLVESGKKHTLVRNSLTLSGTRLLLFSTK